MSASSPFSCHTIGCFLPVLKVTFLWKTCSLLLSGGVHKTLHPFEWGTWTRTEELFQAESASPLSKNLQFGHQTPVNLYWCLIWEGLLHERPLSTKCKEKLRRLVMWRKWRGLTEAKARDLWPSTEGEPNKCQSPEELDREQGQRAVVLVPRGFPVLCSNLKWDLYVSFLGSTIQPCDLPVNLSFGSKLIGKDSVIYNQKSVV